MSRGSEQGTGDFPAGPRPGPRDTHFFDDARIDQLLRALVSLTMELSVTRDRLEALERMLEQQGQLDRSALDALIVPADVEQARNQRRRALIADILGPMVTKLSKGEGDT